MTGRDENDNLASACRTCRDQLQDYLDGTLDKTESLKVFLHLRECGDCTREHDQLQALFGLLESLPAATPPADFDARILASVPLASYRAMEPLRRERVPVFLEQESLPAAVRSRATRLAGLGIAAVACGVLAAGGPAWLGLPAVAGALPEGLVRLQSAGRWLALNLRRSEG